MSNNLLYNLPVTALSNDGRGIAFLSDRSSERGKAVFVSGALPGQTVNCALVKTEKKYAEARVLEIVESDASILSPICAHSAECGGCPLQKLPYNEQLKWKGNFLLDALERIGGIERPFLQEISSPIVASPLTRQYRNKVELAFGLKDKKLICGFRQAKTHKIVNIQDCALIDPIVITLKNRFVELTDNYAFPLDDRFWRFLTIRKGFINGRPKWWLLLLTGKTTAEQRHALKMIGKSLLSGFDSLAAVIHEERHKADFLAMGEKRIFCLDRTERENSRPAVLKLPLGSRFFKLDAVNFFQINEKASQKLTEIAKNLDHAGGNLLDLYCGVGAPGQLLAPEHDFCLGMERDPVAIQFAKINAGNLNGQWLVGDIKKILAKAEERIWQTCILDPPRGGTELEVIAAIKKLGPDRIIYISCNPVTLARDVARFKPDYELKDIAGVDMFPHTPHVESCALLKHT